MMNVPIVSPRFQLSHPRCDAYVYVRRGIPIAPRMCIGKKARLKPMNVSQNEILPQCSSSFRPHIFGPQ